MKIAVLVKNVPDTTDVEYDLSESRIVREKAPGTLNADDIAAVEVALQMKDKYGAEVVLITLAPPLAEDMLRELLAMGADSAIHIQGEEFRGSDGLATARTLTAALQKSSYDLILTGLRSADGNAGQMGPRIAEALNLPCITYAEGIGEINEGKIHLEKRYGDEIYVLDVTLPAVITVQRHLVKARLASVQGILEAAMKEVDTPEATSLNLSPELIGKSGSGVHLISVQKREMKKTPEILEGEIPDIADKLLNRLAERGVLEKKTG